MEQRKRTGRALMVCGEPGCIALVDHGTGGRCETHQRPRLNDRPAFQSTARPGARERGYDRQWQMLRRRWLRDDPQCARCGAPATDVDHITPFRGPDGEIDDLLRLSETNLQSLCRTCHAAKTAREAAVARRRRRADRDGG